MATIGVVLASASIACACEAQDVSDEFRDGPPGDGDCTIETGDHGEACEATGCAVELDLVIRCSGDDSADDLQTAASELLDDWRRAPSSAALGPAHADLVEPNVGAAKPAARAHEFAFALRLSSTLAAARHAETNVAIIELLAGDRLGPILVDPQHVIAGSVINAKRQGYLCAPLGAVPAV